MKQAHVATRKRNDKRLAIRVTALDLENWRFVAANMGFTLSAMIRHAVNQYLETDLPADDHLTDLRMGDIVKLFNRAKCKIDRAWLRETTRCDKTIVLRLPSTELKRWKLAADFERRSPLASTPLGRSVSGMVRRAVRRYSWQVTPHF